MLKNVKELLKPRLFHLVNISYVLLALFMAVRIAYHIANNLEAIVVVFIALILFGIPIAFVCASWYGFWDSLYK